MVDVIFYEKPGCSGNARQKKLLAAAGHTVLPRDLRREPWTRLRLLSFFAGLPVARWFNSNAPAVKSGAIVPEEIDEIAALTLMLADPLLIRRPLLEVGDERRVGFDVTAIDAWIGLGGSLPREDMEACRHDAGESCAGHEPESAGSDAGGRVTHRPVPGPACGCRD